MSQDALHDNLVLYFLEQLIRDIRIKNFLYGYWRSIQCAFVDYREATLSDLVTKFYISFRDFSNSRHRWESTSRNWDFTSILGECLEVCFMDFFLQTFYFIDKPFLLSPFILEFCFQLVNLSILLTSCSGSIHWLSALIAKIHPVTILLLIAHICTKSLVTTNGWRIIAF